MAVIRYITNDGGATMPHDGVALGSAFNMNEALMWLNSLGTLTDHVFLYYCGNFTPSDAQFGIYTYVGPTTGSVNYKFRLIKIEKGGTSSFRVVFQGRTADGTADAQSDIDANGLSLTVDPAPDQPGIFEPAGASVQWLIFRNLTVRHYHSASAGSSSYAWHNTQSNTIFYRCFTDDIEVDGFDGGGSNLFFWQCWATASERGNWDLGGTDNKDRHAIECVSSHSEGAGFGLSGMNGIYSPRRCILYRNGVSAPANDDEGDGLIAGGRVETCTCHQSINHNYRQKDTHAHQHIVNSLATGSANGAGFSITDATPHFLLRFGTWNNQAGRIDNMNLAYPDDNEDPLVVADPYLNAAQDNYYLNNDPGGGLRCQGRLMPVTYLGTNTKSCHDIGAVQTKCPTFVAGPPPFVPQGGWSYEYAVARIHHAGKLRWPSSTSL